MFSPDSTKKVPDKSKGNAKVGIGERMLDTGCWMLVPEFHQLLVRVSSI
jgi:hypothetical protein